MKSIVTLLAFMGCLSFLHGQRIQVSENQRFLVTEDGKPFFWLGDTAWELIHRCDREEVDLYLETRAAQGFNVIQTVVLAELHGLTDPSPDGHTPLLDLNPATPNPAYFEHVDYILDKAEELGLNVALLPTWGDKVFTNNWGVGPEVFTPANARVFGEWIGARYRERDNLIWVIGGDRNPREDSDDVRIWRSMAEGIVTAAGGYERTLMSYHPQPTERAGSSQWFHQDPWLDFNMHQTGHCANKGTYKHIVHDYQLKPTKPVLDGEPLYEDHPNCFNAKELGHSVPRDIRRIMYWNVFAGACGQSYGCHAVWQMYQPGRKPINQPLRPWKQALHLPMAEQVVHLKNLMLSRPYLTRIPAQEMVRHNSDDYEQYVSATRDSEGTYAMIYCSRGQAATVDLSSLKEERLRAWWYDPRTGFATPVSGEFSRSSSVGILPPTNGLGHDWVWVVEGASSDWEAPGKLRE